MHATRRIMGGNGHSRGLVSYASRYTRRLALAIQEQVHPDDLANFMHTVCFLGIDPVTQKAVSFEARMDVFKLMLSYGLGKPISITEMEEILKQDAREGGRELIPNLRDMTLEQIQAERRKLQLAIGIMPEPSKTLDEEK